MEEFDVAKLFNAFDTTESLALLFFMIVSFLLGFLVAYLLRSRVVRRLRKALKANREELEETQAQNKQFREQLELKEADMQRLRYEINEGRDKVSRLESERSRFYNEAKRFREDLVESETQREHLAAQLSEMEAKNELLKADVTQKDDETNDLAQLQSVYLATKRRVTVLEGQVEALQTENRNLRDNQIGGVDTSEGTARQASSTETGAEFVENEPEIVLDREDPVLTQKIDLEDHNQDDLTLIDGIGPFLEKKLNEIGIFTYSQLAALPNDQIPQLTRAIGHIPGRIERDNWTGQAAQLAGKPQDRTPEAFEHSRAIPAEASQTSHDLTVIEGIGPILQSILNDAGIQNWQDLAESDDEELKAILLAEGPGYKIIDPSSWPAQARLALNGDWDLLLEYKDELNGKK